VNVHGSQEASKQAAATAVDAGFEWFKLDTTAGSKTAAGSASQSHWIWAGADSNCSTAGNAESSAGAGCKAAGSAPSTDCEAGSARSSAKPKIAG